MKRVKNFVYLLTATLLAIGFLSCMNDSKSADQTEQSQMGFQETAPSTEEQEEIADFGEGQDRAEVSAQDIVINEDAEEIIPDGTIDDETEAVRE